MAAAVLSMSSSVPGAMSGGASSAPSTAAFVRDNFWSIFEETGMADIANSLLKQSSPRNWTAASQQQQPSPAGKLPGADTVDGHGTGGELLLSPLRSIAFSSLPSPWQSLYSPLAPSSLHPPASSASTPASPSTLIMLDSAKRSSYAPPSSLSAFSPSPSRPSSLFLRSPSSLPNGIGPLRHSPAGGSKSAFMPVLYSSPAVKLEAGRERVEDDDVTQSSFPSLASSLSSASTISSPPSLPSSTSMPFSMTASPLQPGASVLSPFHPLLSFSSLQSHKRSLSATAPSLSTTATTGSTSPPVSPTRSKRVKRSESPTPLSSSSAAGSQGRQQKGLRHFSLKVCEKVEQQGVTTYNNVADELVRDLAADPSMVAEDDDGDDEASGSAAAAAKAKRKSYDEKNIRRRVYDALNVLMAMGIIVKEKKKITWIGLPGGVSQHVTKLGEDKRRREARLKEKRAQLQELLVFIVALKNLKQRNAAAVAAAPASPAAAAREHIPLRFLLIKTAASHIVHLSVSPEQTQLQCDVSGPFLVHDESELLKLMGLAHIDSFDLPYLIPREICSFYPQRYIKRTAAAPTQLDDSVGGRIGPGTVSLGGTRR